MATFNKQQIKSLPTLVDVVKRIRKNIEDKVATGLWNDSYHEMEDLAWDVPFGDIYNGAGDDKFIVVQTQRKRHTLKPNLKHCPYLFRGQNKVYPRILSSFTRDEYDKTGKPIDEKVVHAKHLLGNLQAEEFISLLRTHPLFMMLDRGIILHPESKPIFLNMNYYGLAQHYNFKTAVVDFTTDIDVAAFFACTKNIGNDKYEPITDTNAYPYGVIYIHEINPRETFKFSGFSTIGLQLYPRTGAQKGILFNEPKARFPLEKMVKPIYFRHDAGVSRHFFQKMDGKLFPNDGICEKAKEILQGNEISGLTFALNLYSNQEYLSTNWEELESMGIRVNWHKQLYFTDDMLQVLENDLKNGLWEQFCNQIYFADKEKGKMMHESLLRLPNNPAYAHYFKKDEYKRITEYEADMHKRALDNRKKRIQRGFINK